MFYVSSGYSYLMQLPPGGNIYCVIKESVAVIWMEENEFFSFHSSYVKEAAYIPILSIIPCGALHSDW